LSRKPNNAGTEARTTSVLRCARFNRRSSSEIWFMALRSVCSHSLSRFCVSRAI